MTVAEVLPIVQAGDAAALKRALADEPELARARDANGVSLLLTACYYGHEPIARILAENRTDIDVFEASVLGDAARVGALLEADPSIADSFSADGFTPLGFAAYFGRVEVARVLLSHGATPGLASRNGLNVAPLHSALSGGHRELADLLIEHGADVNAAGGEGWTPLHYVAHSGDAETARRLLARGANPGAARADGVTPGQLAAASGHPEIAAMLS